MIERLTNHYSFTNPATVHDEEALTALELAGRTAAKMNQVVDDQNALRQETEEYNEKTRTETVPAEVEKEFQNHINDGTFDQMINEYIGNLEQRIDSILDSLVEGGTTMDAEIVDARTGADGTKYSNLGTAVRNALAMGNLIDSSNYAKKMPDVNNVLYPSVHVFNFVLGEKNIPAHLPFTEWYGRIGIMFTIAGTYYRQIYIDDNQILTRNGTRSDNWSQWRTLSKPEYIIDINGNGDFSSILKALKAHPTNARFIIRHGEYDIRQQYMNVYGDDYFSNYTGYAGTGDVMDRGLFLGDGVELIGEGYVELLWDYPYDNENVRKYFSVLNTSQNNVVENIHITIEDNSCRYMIHDDYASDGGRNVFRNITFKGYSHLGTAIGGGFGIYNTYLIENCVFTDLQESIAISYHNNASDAKNTLTIRDCYCEGTIYLKHYGSSVQKSKAYITNCHAKKIVLTHADAGSYPNENIELIEWNNLTDVKPDVTPQMFGATGDGVTDDYEAIQKACDYINKRGGTLYFPIGTYIISKGIVLYKGTSLIGESTDRTIIKASESFTPVNDSVISFRHENNHCDNVTLKNITIHGNGSDVACLTVFSGYDYVEIQNVHVRGVGSTSDGIRLIPNPDIIDVDRVSQGLYVVNVIVYMDKVGATGNAFYIDSVQESTFINVKAFSQIEYPEIINTKSVGYYIVDSRGLTFKNISCGNKDNTIYPIIVKTVTRESAGIFIEDITFESSANFLKTEGSATYPITSLVMRNVRDEGSGSSTVAVVLNHTRKSFIIIPIGNISDNNGVSNVTYVEGMVRANTSRGFDFFDFADNTTPTLHLAYPWGAKNTALEVMINIDGTITQRTLAVGEADSAGSGYRTVRVLN